MNIQELTRMDEQREMIALFMGYLKLPGDNTWYKKVNNVNVPAVTESYWTPESNPAHLAPVIDRIECGDYTVTVSKEGCIIKSDDYEAWPDEDEAFHEEHQGTSRHNSTFTAIVSFLKWVKENNITI